MSWSGRQREQVGIARDIASVCNSGAIPKRRNPDPLRSGFRPMTGPRAPFPRSAYTFFAQGPDLPRGRRHNGKDAPHPARSQLPV
jgi:hypothetical protein